MSADGGKRAAAEGEREEFVGFFPQIVRDLTEEGIGHPEVGDAVARLKEVRMSAGWGSVGIGIGGCWDRGYCDRWVTGTGRYWDQWVAGGVCWDRWVPGPVGTGSSGTGRYQDWWVLGSVDTRTRWFWDWLVPGSGGTGTGACWELQVLGSLGTGTGRYWELWVLGSVGNRDQQVLGPVGTGMVGTKTGVRWDQWVLGSAAFRTGGDWDWWLLRSVDTGTRG